MQQQPSQLTVINDIIRNVPLSSSSSSPSSSPPALSPSAHHQTKACSHRPEFESSPTYSHQPFENSTNPPSRESLRHGTQITTSTRCHSHVQSYQQHCDDHHETFNCVDVQSVQYTRPPRDFSHRTLNVSGELGAMPNHGEIDALAIHSPEACWPIPYNSCVPSRAKSEHLKSNSVAHQFTATSPPKPPHYQINIDSNANQINCSCCIVSKSSRNGNEDSSCGQVATFPDRLTFPDQLRRMLDDATPHGFDDIVSWHSDGKSFKVYQPSRFSKHELIGAHFNHIKYKSFLRQLNLYGFERIAMGPRMGGYFHPHFIRGWLDAPRLQRWKGSKSGMSDGCRQGIAKNTIHECINLETNSIGEENDSSIMASKHQGTFHDNKPSHVEQDRIEREDMPNDKEGFEKMSTSFVENNFQLPDSFPIFDQNPGAPTSMISLLEIDLDLGFSVGPVNKGAEEVTISRAIFEDSRDVTTSSTHSLMPRQLPSMDATTSSTHSHIATPMSSIASSDSVATNRSAFVSNSTSSSALAAEEKAQDKANYESAFVSALPTPHEEISVTMIKNAHRLHSFPWMLYDMLQNSEPHNFDHIVSWCGESAFKIHKHDEFVKRIMPYYFGGQHHYESFRRQLNIYGFYRTRRGPNRGMCSHEYLKRGDRDCCFGIRRRVNEK